MEKDVKVEPMNLTFARVMEILTYIGIILMIVPGAIYVVTGSGYINTVTVAKYWDKPAKVFWESTKGVKIHGYSWFLSHLGYMDCLSMLGISLLALAPLASVISAIPKADSKYKLLLTILVVEYIIAITRPLFMYH